MDNNENHLQASKEKHLLASDYEGSKDNSALGTRTYHQGFKFPIEDQNLVQVREEIKVFLQSEKSTPTSKFIERISNAYENHISIQDREIQKLNSNLTSLKQSESVRNTGTLPF